LESIVEKFAKLITGGGDRDSGVIRASAAGDGPDDAKEATHCESVALADLHQFTFFNLREGRA
jgi:hypothetical protein